MRRTALFSGGLLLMSLLLWMARDLSIPYVDGAADRYFEDSIKKAGATYAVARVINASVSVIKDSSLAIEPFGVGINISVGEVLDPIDDLTERLSDVLMAAIVSLGVQKLVNELAVGLSTVVVASIFLFCAILVWVPQARSNRFLRRMARLLGFVIIVRFFLPASAVLSDYIEEHFISPKVATAETQLKLASEEIGKFSEITPPEKDGILGTIANSKEFVAEKFNEFAAALGSLKENLGTIVDNILTLAWLYTAMLIVQVVAIPLLAFYLLAKLLNAFLNVRYQVAMNP